MYSTLVSHKFYHIIVYDDQQWRYFTYILFYKPTLRRRIEMSLIDEADVAVTLWTCNRNVLGSNPGRDTGYPEIFCSFPQFLQENASVHTYSAALYSNPQNVSCNLTVRASSNK
jgi:hypothetical protein